MSDESKGAVLSALGANLAIAAGKTIAGVITGSAAMLAEAGHSFADTFNQVFLLVGIRNSRTAPDARHPHGYGREAFFWSFLVAVTMFTAGAVFALYEGVRTITGDHDHHRSNSDLMIAFGVLGMAFLFESFSMTVATRTLMREARKKSWSIRSYLGKSPNLVVKTVFFEDAAALLGLIVAAGGIATSELAGTEIWDGVASLVIAGLLAVVAFTIGMQSRRLLLAASADEETDARIREIVSEFPEVQAIVRMMTTQAGIHSIIVTGELELKRDMRTQEVEVLIGQIDAELSRKLPEVTSTFWELRRRPIADVPEPASN